MANWLKRPEGPQATGVDRLVRDVVERTLEDIATRGDAAVRDLSVKFDGWERESYRLSERETQDCLDQLSHLDLADIEFAQTQANIRVRRYGGRNVPYAGRVEPVLGAAE